jgi:hypothetical protein
MNGMWDSLITDTYRDKEVSLPINCNSEFTVELTDAGKEFLAAYYDAIELPQEWRRELEPGDTLRVPLWDLMHVFGPHMRMGQNRVPFKGNVMTLTVIR